MIRRVFDVGVVTELTHDKAGLSRRDYTSTLVLGYSVYTGQAGYISTLLASAISE